MKLLSITPHLSTGGAPQVLVKRIELIKDVFDIYVVEYSNISDRYIVQKNMIKELLGIDKLITLGENKFEILNVIKDIDPDIIHFEEIPEMFMDYNISKKIYSGDRKYKIFETTHSSDFNVNNKIFLPDKFLFVSQYNSFKFNKFGVPIEVIEYPIEKKKVKKSDKEKYMSELGMDPSYKHVLNVGLFTPRKNQAYSFDISRELGDEKIIVHFVGNQADNFKHYWEPLMKRKPKNSVVWGERSDVYKFYIACDAFLFTSRGFKYDKELNPLVIKEALEHNMKLFLFPLDVYCGKYDDDPNVKYLTGNLTVDSNMVKDFLFEEKNDSETIDPFDIKIIKIEDKNDSFSFLNDKYHLNKFNLLNIDDGYIINCNRISDIGRIDSYGLGEDNYRKYLTYKDILNNNLESDILIIIDNDINLKSNNNLFIDKIDQSINLIEKYDLDCVSLSGSYDIRNGEEILKKGPIENDFYKIDRISQIGFLILSKSGVKSLVEYMDNNKWDDIDIILDEVLKNKAISKEPLVVKKLKKMTNEIFIISSYPDTKKKSDVTYDCITKIKYNNFKTILSSHTPVDKRLQDISDHYIYDSYNPLINHTLYKSYWYDMGDYRSEINLDYLSNSKEINQSLTVYNNIYNSVSMAKILGYEYVVNMNFDFILSQNDFDVISNIIDKIYDENSEGYFMRYKDNGIDCLKTVFFIIKVDTFLKLFDNYRSPENFRLECDRIESHNFLESFFYKKIKDNLHRFIIEDKSENNLFNGDINLFSGNEYLTFLNVDGSDDEFVLYYCSRNLVDDRKIIIKFYIDNDIQEVYDHKIDKDVHMYKLFRVDNRETRVDVSIVSEDDRIMRTESVSVNINSINKLKNNGLFLLRNRENKNLNDITTIINYDIDDFESLDRYIPIVKGISENIIIVIPDRSIGGKRVDEYEIKRIEDRYGDDYDVILYEVDLSINKDYNYWCNISRQIGKDNSRTEWVLFLSPNENIDKFKALIKSELNSDCYIMGKKDSPLLIKNVDIDMVGNRRDIFDLFDGKKEIL